MVKFISDAVINQMSEVVLKAIKVAASQVPSGKGYRLNEKTSNFIQSLDVSIDNIDDKLFTIILPDYIRYIESGRPAHAPKVPVKALVTWASEKHLNVDNDVIYAIREAIYRDGIAPRPMFEAISQAANAAIGTFKPSLLNAIKDSITKHLMSVLK